MWNKPPTHPEVTVIKGRWRKPDVTITRYSEATSHALVDIEISKTPQAIIQQRRRWKDDKNSHQHSLFWAFLDYQLTEYNIPDSETDRVLFNMDLFTSWYLRIKMLLQQMRQPHMTNSFAKIVRDTSSNLSEDDQIKIIAEEVGFFISDLRKAVKSS